ncbi:hypothetical protein Sp245p_26380 (plasmid) [Azospirillum baldaniorum]|uniref:Uncharacterized protein n=1 Tax=Azospirillum baldaniorum TaxID=1064539 RepID=A0A9P1JZW0_9PROT|nr:hypothetical protein [Azospirillum baldaniorum]AWJ93253.1 hypothetical protein Sp245p_25865 [Azospirillum baldaniorum]AWJ93351.1 hypothetical protein Sp245p_26380 [Azospirillum baldaniorum]TWA77947.1 hypothetical protein FBZ85_106107 [Azospirillum brasilense]CCD02953.1 protein of unknown function [Azospirillum baldaniorum]
MGIDREDAAEHWSGLSDKAIDEMVDLGIAPTAHVEDRRAKGWTDDGNKFYMTSDSLRKLGYAEAADWLDRRAGVQPEPPPPPLVFTYTNWRGEHGTRRAIPIRVYHGATEYHPEPQWLMEAHDLDKGAVRVFAMRDMGPDRSAALLTTETEGVDHG